MKELRIWDEKLTSDELDFAEKFIKFYEDHLDLFNFLIVILCWFITLGMLIFSLLIMKGEYDGIYFNDDILHIIGIIGFDLSILSIFISFMTTDLFYESYRYDI